MTGLCLSRRTVLCTYHMHSCSRPGSSFCISVQERYFLFAHLPLRCTSMSLDLELVKILDEFVVLEVFRAKFLDSVCHKVSHQSWTVCMSVRRAYKAACARDAFLSRGRDSPGEDMDAPIESHRRRMFFEEHAKHHRFSRQPSDTLLGRLDREKDRATFNVINLAKVVSVAAQSAHTKHIEVAFGISFNLDTHEPLEASGDSKAMGLVQWLLNLRILYNCYSIIGVRKVATSANSESMWCSWQVVSFFVDTLTDLATANIPGTKMLPTTGVLQLAELNLHTRVVDLLRLGAEGGFFTFDDAFSKAFIEKQSLFHCALSPQTRQQCCKNSSATSSSEMCRRQPHFRSPGATEN